MLCVEGGTDIGVRFLLGPNGRRDRKTGVLYRVRRLVEQVSELLLDARGRSGVASALEDVRHA